MCTEALPSIRSLYPKGFILQQDAATPHTSKATNKWIIDQKLMVPPWPANFPGLNPIENVWGLMKKAVERRNPKNLQDLERSIDEIWNGLSVEYLKTLIGSMRNRIVSYITRKGEKIDY